MSKYMQVLDWVNEVRRDLGIDPIPELIPGDCGDPNRCVIANSLKCGLHSTHPVPVSVRPSATPSLPEYVVRPGRGVPYTWSGLPDVVNDFAVKFDNDFYPELVAR